MIEPEKRKAIYLLSKEGMSVREIARRLRVSRKAVRRIIRQGGEAPTVSRPEKIRIDRSLLERLHKECEGWKHRIHEKLEKEEKIKVAYSTLTRILRDHGIGRESERRCDRVPDEPGAEMQHDTSPYTLDLGGQPTRVIASSIYLRYSKRRYLRFYRRFDRFRMKCFLHEALLYWGYAAKICIIDNTNLARLRGTGEDAVMVLEMAAFAKQYGYKFVCHAIGHSNRKAGEERSFWTVETNFFPGRTFRDLEDLNAQGIDWATVRMYHRPLTKSRLISAAAFEHERAYLTQLPPHLPAPYRVHVFGLPWLSEYGLQQTRGFRALKVWMSLKHHGLSGYAEAIARDIALAEHLARLVDASADLERLAAGLSVVCFRYVPPAWRGDAARLDKLNKALLETLQSNGQAFLSSTTFDDTFALRACIVNPRTRPEDLERLVALVGELGAQLAGKTA